MKRFHVHVNVHDLDDSIRFYSQLFGTSPVVHKPDYAKWMLDDPRLNFAVSSRGRSPGLDHLGLQVDHADELDQIGIRLKVADALSLSETRTTCCYAHSDKHWASDPQGVRWESFRTLGEATTYSVALAAGQTCCGPQDPSPSSDTGGQASCGPHASCCEAGG